MIEVAVGSQNPTKLEAVRLAVPELYLGQTKIMGFATKSAVSDQPMSDEEMIMGAHNRARNVISYKPSARYAVGMEGGIKVMPEGWFNLGWVCVIDVDTGNHCYGTTPAHFVPDKVKTLMEQSGLEMSDAVAELYKTHTVIDRDCSGVMTDGRLPAEELYRTGVLAAFSVLMANQNS